MWLVFHDEGTSLHSLMYSAKPSPEPPHRRAATAGEQQPAAADQQATAAGQPTTAADEQATARERRAEPSASGPHIQDADQPAAHLQSNTKQPQGEPVWQQEGEEVLQGTQGGPEDKPEGSQVACSASG